MSKLTQQQYWELKSDFHIDESIHKDLPSTKRMVIIYLGITIFSIISLYFIAYFTQSEFFYDGLRHVSAVLLVSLIPYAVMIHYLRKGQVKMRENKAIIALSSMTWQQWEAKSENEQEEMLYELKNDISGHLSYYNSSMSTMLVFIVLIPQFYLDGEVKTYFT